jgi:hypothetical protein
MEAAGGKAVGHFAMLDKRLAWMYWAPSTAIPR